MIEETLKCFVEPEKIDWAQCDSRKFPLSAVVASSFSSCFIVELDQLMQTIHENLGRDERPLTFQWRRLVLIVCLIGSLDPTCAFCLSKSSSRAIVCVESPSMTTKIFFCVCFRSARFLRKVCYSNDKRERQNKRSNVENVEVFSELWRHGLFSKYCDTTFSIDVRDSRLNAASAWAMRSLCSF